MTEMPSSTTGVLEAEVTWQEWAPKDDRVWSLLNTQYLEQCRIHNGHPKYDFKMHL